MAAPSTRNIIPLLPEAVAAETITVDKWLSYIPDPVRPIARPVDEGASLHDWQRLGDPEAATLDKWHFDLPAIVRAAPQPVAEGFSGFDLQGRPEDPTLDKWHQPISEPVRPILRAVDEGFLTLDLQGLAEFPSLDKWYFDVPTQLSLPPAVIDPMLFAPFVEEAAVETITPDKWLSYFENPIVQPMRIIPESVFPGFIGCTNTVTIRPVSNAGPNEFNENSGAPAWSMVSDQDDASYIQNGMLTNPGAVEKYLFPDLTSILTGQSIEKITVWVRARRIAAEAVTFTIDTYDIFGTKYPGPSIAVSGSLVDYSAVLTKSPLSDQPWTATELAPGAAGFAAGVTAGAAVNDALRITEVWLEVTYACSWEETTFVSAWGQAISIPVWPVPHPVDAGFPPIISFEEAPAETITIDKWFSDPQQVWLVPAALNWLTEPPAVPETPQLDKWLHQVSEPVWPIRHPVPEGFSQLLWQPFFDPTMDRWYMAPEQVWLPRPPITPVDYALTEVVTPETVTLDKWLSSAEVPTTLAPQVLYALFYNLPQLVDDAENFVRRDVRRLGLRILPSGIVVRPSRNTISAPGPDVRPWRRRIEP